MSEILPYLVLVTLIGFGFFAIFLNFFGTFIILLGAFLFAWMTAFTIITLPLLIILLVLYIVGELFDYLMVMLGAKTFGASRQAIWGAVLGGFLGGFIGLLFFGIGMFPGSLIGIFLGAFFMEYQIRKDVGKSVSAGTGGLFGVFSAIVLKCVIGLMMTGIVAVRIVQAFLQS